MSLAGRSAKRSHTGNGTGGTETRACDARRNVKWDNRNKNFKQTAHRDGKRDRWNGKVWRRALGIMEKRGGEPRKVGRTAHDKTKNGTDRLEAPGKQHTTKGETGTK